MPEKEKEKIIMGFDKILGASRDTIANNMVNMYFKKSAKDRIVPYDGRYMLQDENGKWTVDATADKIKGETEDATRAVISRIEKFHPLYGLAGRLRVNYKGLIYDLKPSGDKSESDARDFWDNLLPHQKNNTLNAVRYYNNIYKELKLSRYVK